MHAQNALNAFWKPDTSTCGNVPGMDTVITGLYLSSSARREALIVALCAACAVFLPARLLPHQHYHQCKTCMKLDLIRFCMLNHMQKNCSSSHLQPLLNTMSAFGVFIFTETSREWSANTFSSGPCSASCHQRQKQKWRLCIFASKIRKWDIHFLSFWSILLCYNKDKTEGFKLWKIIYKW